MLRSVVPGSGSGGTSGVTGLQSRLLALPNQALQKKVMASPPAVTLTTSHTIGTPRQWPSILATGAATTYGLGGDEFTYSRAANPNKTGNSAFDELFINFFNINYGGGTFSNNGYKVSLMHYGSAIEFGFRGLGGYLLCQVNDEFITLTPRQVNATGEEWFYYIPFGSVALRRIDLWAVTCPFSGVYTAATDTVFPAPQRGPKAVIIGDSFTEGAVATVAGLTDYAATLGIALGWDNVIASGVGSTGYLAAPAPKVKYRDRISTDVIALNPQVVFITGGYNDIGGSTASQIQTEAGLLIAALKAGLPNAVIVWVAPYWTGGVETQGLTMCQITEALRTVALANGCVWISLTEQKRMNRQSDVAATLSSSPAAGATSFTVNKPLATGNTYKFTDGTKFRVRSMAGASPTWTVTTDSPISTAHTSGQAITQCGPSLWQGNGRVGTTTGYGNADILVSSDGVHPTQAGHDAIAYALASELINYYA